MFISFEAPFETIVYHSRSHGAFNTQLVFVELLAIGECFYCFIWYGKFGHIFNNNIYTCIDNINELLCGLLLYVLYVGFLYIVYEALWLIVQKVGSAYQQWYVTAVQLIVAKYYYSRKVDEFRFYLTKPTFKPLEMSTG